MDKFWEITDLMSVSNIQNHLSSMADPESARFLQKFFKTGPGEYGEGDLFRGIRVPLLRKLVKEFPGATLPEVRELLHSPYHEDRLLALLILVRSYANGDEVVREKIYNL